MDLLLYKLVVIFRNSHSNFLEIKVLVLLSSCLNNIYRDAIQLDNAHSRDLLFTGQVWLQQILCQNISQLLDILEIQLVTNTFDRNWGYTVYH